MQYHIKVPSLVFGKLILCNFFFLVSYKLKVKWTTEIWNPFKLSVPIEAKKAISRVRKCKKNSKNK